MFGLIYKATNIQDRKVYIGFTTKTLDERKQKHLDFSNLSNRRRSHFHDTIKSVGIHNFKWEILGYCGNEKELKEAEIECIYFYRSFGSDGINHDRVYGYNHTIGGEGVIGYQCDEEQREKRRKSALGKIVTQETRDKLSKAHKGKKFTEKHKKNLSIAFTGRKLSEAHKQKISKLQTGKVLSEETKQKMSKSKLGENNSMFGKNVFENKTEEEMKIISEKMSKVKLGENNPFYGKKHTEATKTKIRNYYKENGANFLGEHHTEESKQKLSESHTINLPIDEIVDYYYNKKLNPIDICKIYSCSEHTIVRRLQKYKKDNNLGSR